jgi:hypothetical protein
MLPKIKICLITQGLSFIVAQSTAALLHMKSASTKTPRDSCCAQDNETKKLTVVSIGV